VTPLPAALPWRHPTTLRCLEGPAARAFLRTKWAELYALDPLATVYQGPGWVHGCAAVLPSAANVVVLVAENLRGEPEAALALQRDHNQHGRARLRPLGTPLAEYIRAVGPAAAQPSAMLVLAQHLVNQAELGTQVVMPDLPGDSCLSWILGTQPGWLHTTVECAAVSLPLNLTAVGRATRRAHHRRERIWAQLAARGRVAFTRTQTAEELAAAAATTQELHRRRWAGHPALHADDSHDVTEVLAHCGPGEAFVAQLRLDDAVVASTVCLVRDRTCYSLLPAMLPEAADLAPGHSLIRHLAVDLARQRYTRLDLGRTVPAQRSYKAQYSPCWTVTRTAISHGIW